MTAQRSADESRELLEALLEHAPVGFAYFDRDLRYVAVNRALAEINGVPAEEHVGRRVSDVLPEMDPSMERDLEQVLRTGRALLDVELSGVTPRFPGRRRHFQASYYRVRIPGGAALGIGATLVEVTRRRIAEDELRAQRDLYETLLRAQSEAGEAFVLFYGERITYANDAAEILTGRSIDELRALDSYLEVVPEPRRAGGRRGGRRDGRRPRRTTRASRPRSSAPTDRSRRWRSPRVRCAAAAACSSSCSAAT